MSFKSLMTGLMLCLPLHTLNAATIQYEGTVKDESGNPLEFANVTLIAPSDSTLIGGSVTDAAGHFIVSAPDIPLRLRVSAMGFDDRIMENPTSSIGIITLRPASYMLGEVVVKGSRPTTKLKSDGVQVAISGTYLENTGTALEVLAKMPFVTRSGSDLEVLGKGTPLVYINGRQVRDRSELDRLSSSQIKSMEVVTSPGARYASTINAVIRITTVSPVGEGFSVSDRTTVGYKYYPYLFEQVNLNYRKNEFDLFGMLNYENYRERLRNAVMTDQYLPSATVSQQSYNHEKSIYPVYQGKIGLNYTLQSHNMGVYYDFSFRPSTSSGISHTSRFVDNTYSEMLDNTTSGNRHDRQHLLSAYYTGTIGRWQLSANFDALWQINDTHNDVLEQSSVNTARTFLTVNDVTNRLLAGNIIASLPVWKGSLRFGTEISNIHRSDRYSGNADYITENDIKISETTSALFAETMQTFGTVSANLGLRWEYTDSRYWQFGILSSDQSRRYNNLAPSVSISIPIGNINTSLNYTQKTTRPAFGQLSSAVKYIDRYSYESGNPTLKPIYRDYISASASWRNLVVELEYIYTKNYFMWQTSPYPGNHDATLLTMVNMPGFSSYGAYINYSPTFFGCWHPSLMAGMEAQDFTITHAGSDLHLDRPMGIFRLNNAFHLPGDIWLNMDFSARTSGNADNMYLKSTWQCDLGIYKSFADDTWSLKLQLNDAFDTSRQQFTFYDALSTIILNKTYDTRDLSLTLRYNFNTTPSRYKGKGTSTPQKSRL